MPLTAAEIAEIEAARSQRSETRRPTVAAMEEALFQAVPVLDHGFVRVVDYMGDDAAVVQAARVSYGKGTKSLRDDAGLIRYLMRHRHSTPFEMCEIKFHVKLPIFVARQWIRHRTANVNEYSARYSVLDREFYIPEGEKLKFIEAEARREAKSSKRGQTMLLLENQNIAQQSTVNKQGRDRTVSAAEAARAARTMRKVSEHAFNAYFDLLNEPEGGAPPDETRSGIARELARAILPVNVYTQWYWKTDLHNLMHFLSLRADPHAQHEIRVYAEAMLTILDKWVPQTAAAFREYRLGAVQLSATALAIVRRLLAGEEVDQAASGLSKREWRELMTALGRDG
ncbi:MAG: FAD-dependent thymidylate synthase [Thalassobaculales bacterium]